MLKSKCTLKLGGMLPSAETDRLLSILHTSGSTFLHYQRTLMSLRSGTGSDITRRMQGDDVSFIFNDTDRTIMAPHLLKIIDEFALDYRWSWEGFPHQNSGVICYDARLGDRQEFLSLGDKIVLAAEELVDPDRCRSAVWWSRWLPRHLTLYSSHHELIEAHASALER
jgi:hypothetical protein